MYDKLIFNGCCANRFVICQVNFFKHPFAGAFLCIWASKEFSCLHRLPVLQIIEKIFSYSVAQVQHQELKYSKCIFTTNVILHFVMYDNIYQAQYLKTVSGMWRVGKIYFA